MEDGLRHGLATGASSRRDRDDPRTRHRLAGSGAGSQCRRRRAARRHVQPRDGPGDADRSDAEQRMVAYANAIGLLHAAGREALAAIRAPGRSAVSLRVSSGTRSLATLAVQRRDWLNSARPQWRNWQTRWSRSSSDEATQRRAAARTPSTASHCDQSVS